MRWHHLHPVNNETLAKTTANEAIVIEKCRIFIIKEEAGDVLKMQVVTSYQSGLRLMNR